MILLTSYSSIVVAVLLALVTAYLYRKNDDRYKYTGAVAVFFGIVGAAGITGFLMAFS